MRAATRNCRRRYAACRWRTSAASTGWWMAPIWSTLWVPGKRWRSRSPACGRTAMPGRGRTPSPAEVTAATARYKRYKFRVPRYADDTARRHNALGIVYGDFEEKISPETGQGWGGGSKTRPAPRG